jgi:hypothetical protein
MTAPQRCGVAQSRILRAEQCVLRPEFPAAGRGESLATMIQEIFDHLAAGSVVF